MAKYNVPEINFQLTHPLMKRIVELKEKGFADAKDYPDAPVDHDDAIENYRRILEICGEVAETIIEPNSESVDQEGPHLDNGRMVYASKTFDNLDATRKAGLHGVSMPRRYGGLNLPNVVFSMLSEMISSADAGFQNIWSLQSCIDTLYEFGSEEQRQQFIPRVCAGESMSMDLTELASEWRQAIHHQRRQRHPSGAGPQRRGHHRWSRPVDVHLRQARRRCGRASH